MRARVCVCGVYLWCNIMVILWHTEVVIIFQTDYCTIISRLWFIHSLIP